MVNEATRKTILLVEDEAPSRAAMTDLLETAGYRVIPTSGGVEALAYLRENPAPDAIISDLVMGLMSGWDLSERQRYDERLADTPLILVSGVPDLEFHAEALSAAAFFPKPVDAQALLRELPSLLEKRELAAAA